MIQNREMFELVKAWLATSLAFGILIYSAEKSFLFSILVAAFTVGLGFLAHELMHRYMARRFKKHAEFHANNQMLIIAILMSFLGVIIAAPGAVYISGMVSRRENGIIALAGPATNLVLALLFIPLFWVIPSIAYYGFMINALMGMFNLIPLPGFDGEKVLAWNKRIFFTVGAIAILMNALNILWPQILNI